VAHGPTTITVVTEGDLAFLWDLLRAAGQDAGLLLVGATGAAPAQDIQGTAFGKYLAEWGRPGDAGVVAWDTRGSRIGAAWYRLFPPAHPGYGFVSADVPELTIRVLAEARGQGIGDSLLRALAEHARQEGYRALSLSVDRGNPAQHLYARHGFADAHLSAPTDTSVTLLNALVACPSSQDGDPPTNGRTNGERESQLRNCR
jgi:ribosomal protein S18 acetylase RimI-like enzyme